MPDREPSFEDPRVARFCGAYFDTLRLFRIPDKARPWYRRHVESFIRAHPGRRLREHSSDSLQHWLATQGRNPQMPAWRIRQHVDALRLLFSHQLQMDWAKSFDWDQWRDGCLALEPDHPTLARTYAVIEELVDEADNPLGKGHPALYRRFLTVMRTRSYSANNEKTYLGWIGRCLLFHGDRDPFVGAEQAVASFLEHLALKRKVVSATQAQALNALVFFYAQVADQPLGDIGSFRQATQPRRLPTV